MAHRPVSEPELLEWGAIDTWSDFGQLVAIVLGVARLVEFVTADELSAPVRERIRAWGFDADRGTIRWAAMWLATCPRCLGFWVSVAWVAMWWAWPTWATIVALPWAVAQAAWWMGGSWLETFDDTEE